MGKTNHKQRSYDEDDRSNKNSRGAKHSRNIPGKGMRVINSWYEEDDDDYFDDDVGVEDEVEIVLNKNTR